MVSFFVTGTDTGVGKTTVAVSLLSAARGRGVRCGVLKPVESGCVGRSLLPADAVRLHRAAGSWQQLEDVCPYRYGPAVAPGVVADDVGPHVSVEHLKALLGQVEADADFVLVEGAGGLLVPVGEGRLIADIAYSLNRSLLVCARDGLGTINHTLLTVEVALARGLMVAGVVLVGMAEAEATDVQENQAQIVSALDNLGGPGASGIPFLGRLPYVPGLGELQASEQEATLGELAEGHLDLGTILDRLG